MLRVNIIQKIGEFEENVLENVNENPQPIFWSKFPFGKQFTQAKLRKYTQFQPVYFYL